ncbi:MAG: O-antigen ligase family protein [Blastocatellia bacterium]
MTDNETTSRYDKAIAFLLCVIPCSATIAYGGVDSWAMSFLVLIVSFVVFLWLADAWTTGKLRISTSALQMPLIALIILGLIQLLPIGDSGVPGDLLTIPSSKALSLDPYATRLFIVRLAVCLVYFAAALTFLNSRKRMQKAAFVVIAFGAVMAFFGIIQSLAAPGAIYGLRPTPQSIPFGPFVNQHHFAGFMEMTSGLVLGLLFGNAVNKDKKLLLWIALVLMILAVIFTGSRGGMLSFIGVAAFASFASLLGRNRQISGEADIKPDSFRRKLSIATGALGFMFVVLGLAVFLGSGESLLRSLGLSDNSSDLSSGRLHYWSVSLDIFAANPIIGAGLDAFGVAFTKYDTLPGLFRVEQAHNDYLQMLADGGIIGFLCVAAFLVILVNSALRNIACNEDKFGQGVAIGALAGCIGILIHSFFDFPLRTPSNAFFFLMLSVLATTQFSDGGNERKRRRMPPNVAEPDQRTVTTSSFGPQMPPKMT